MAWNWVKTNVIVVTIEALSSNVWSDDVEWILVESIFEEEISLSTTTLLHVEHVTVASVSLGLLDNAVTALASRVVGILHDSSSISLPDDPHVLV